MMAELDDLQHQLFRWSVVILALRGFIAAWVDIIRWLR